MLWLSSAKLIYSTIKLFYLSCDNHQACLFDMKGPPYATVE